MSLSACFQFAVSCLSNEPVQVLQGIFFAMLAQLRAQFFSWAFVLFTKFLFKLVVLRFLWPLSRGLRKWNKREGGRQGRKEGRGESEAEIAR